MRKRRCSLSLVNVNSSLSEKYCSIILAVQRADSDLLSGRLFNDIQLRYADNSQTKICQYENTVSMIAHNFEFVNKI